MEYQGLNNWEGLLDPLDNNLRAEILRYGNFVDAVYKSFEFDPSSPSYGSCKFPNNTLLDECGLPNTGYKVTKHLTATSSIQQPRWMNKAPTWVTTQSSYIGFVAVCDDKEEIKRLGRRDIVIAYRGTTTCLEWLENLRATLTHLPMPCKRWTTFHKDQTQTTTPMVQSGFLNLYTSPCKSENSESLQHMVRKEISQILQDYAGEPLSLTVTGHSLGAALATLTAYDIKATFISRLSMTTTVVSFGGPRVGNRRFRQQLEKQGTKVLRIVNSDDVVTKVPGLVLHVGEGHEMREQSGHVAEVQRWINKMEKIEWLYAEVGKELRLCSKDSPYLNRVDFATCHQLTTYLHLVDGFVSSKCPFRATAKRFLP
ncbi:phospholipase A(1) DAD1, chloroplastic [Cajanus cajan]|uniref:Lipase n=1 Tax=Cajanus cajan TaxID=3821 RepID=A0A151RKR4_CAJCA|nr:phospholipase A(1) DAD1, chloroplastic [Cajanus cajan]KYP43151.1 Lipase [Cajanus cajan]